MDARIKSGHDEQGGGETASSIRPWLGRADAGANRAGDARAAEPAIAARVLGEILLVVVLGEIELGRGQDLGRDRPEAARGERLLVSCLRRLGRAALLLGIIVDAGAILGADVIPLAHALRRVV